MSKIKNYYEKLKSAKSIKHIFHIISNSINYRKRVYIVKSINIIELIIEQKAYKKLKRKYYKALEIKPSKKESKKGDTVWTCWFQGLENVPILPKKCIENIKKNFKNYRVVVITNENLNQYIKLPNYILEKYQKGLIDHTHFSDIVRTWLIAEHGGIWIDPTVLVLDSNLPSYLTDEKLFLFSNCSRNSLIAISSWYICADSHNLLLESTKILLEEYWKKEDYPIHYLYFHMLFTLVTEHYPEEWNKVPKISNIPPHMLGEEIFSKYTKKREKELIQMCPLQKLSNGFAKRLPDNLEGTFYEKYILK